VAVVEVVVAELRQVSSSTPRLHRDKQTQANRETIRGWLPSTTGGKSVFGQQTDPVLRSACSRRVTTMWVNRPLQVSRLGAVH